MVVAAGGGLRSDGLDLGKRLLAPPVCHSPVPTRASYIQNPRALGWVSGVRGVTGPALGELSQKAESVGTPMATNHSKQVIKTMSAIC